MYMNELHESCLCCDANLGHQPYPLTYSCWLYIYMSTRTIPGDTTCNFGIHWGMHSLYSAMKLYKQMTLCINTCIVLRPTLYVQSLLVHCTTSWGSRYIKTVYHKEDMLIEELYPSLHQSPTQVHCLLTVCGGIRIRKAMVRAPGREEWGSALCMCSAHPDNNSKRQTLLYHIALTHSLTTNYLSPPSKILIASPIQTTSSSPPLPPPLPPMPYSLYSCRKAR